MMDLQTNPIPAPRSPWLAALLSLLCTGLGHVYAGRVTRGLVLFFLSILAVPLVGLWAVLPPSKGALIAILATLLCVPLLYLFSVFDAWRVARHGRTAYVLREYNRVGLYVLFALAGLVWPALSTTFLRLHVVEAFKVPAGSMAPTIEPGDRILVDKFFDMAGVARGDAVVFLGPEDRSVHYIKRVIGLPGDRIRIEDGALWLNGERVPASPAQGDGRCRTESLDGRSWTVQWLAEGSHRAAMEEQEVPPDHVFVLGDNRDNSRDSRQFGPVPLGDLVGRASYLWFPVCGNGRFGVLR